MLKHDSPINFFLFYAANFFFSAAYFILFPIIPGYAHALKAGVLGVLPITVTYFLAAIIAAPIIGYLIDWKGRLRFALGGAVASTALAFSYSLVDSVILLLLIRTLHGITTAAFSVAMLTILTDATENAWRADIVSAYLIPQLFWIAIGPALALFIFPYGGAKSVFIAAAVFGFLGIIFTIFIKTPKLFALSKQKFSLADYLSFDAALLLASIFVFNAVYSALLLNAHEYIAKIEGDAVAGFYAWFVIAGLLIMYNAGNLSDRIGRGHALLVGLVFLIISLVLMLIADKKATATLAGIFFGIAYGIVLPSLIVWWMDIVPLVKRGMSMGIMHAVQSAGMIIGLWILSVFGLIGIKGVFSAALIFTAAIFAGVAFRQWPEIKARWR